jgi:hypothetical protein
MPQLRSQIGLTSALFGTIGFCHWCDAVWRAIAMKFHAGVMRSGSKLRPIWWLGCKRQAVKRRTRLRRALTNALE